jgi:peptide/nickel transport system ATP-binding protein
MMALQPFVACDNLFKIYQVADLEVVALQSLDLELERGEVMALVGPSGVGKSTLLNVIGGLDTPSAGRVSVAGRDLATMAARERVRYKREVVGFVWQQPARNLLPYLSIRENVELPMQLGGVGAKERRQRSLELLDVVGLAARASFYPDRLSGGEQQRVALAIALANNPPLILGDELTGQIDSASAMRVLDAVRALNEAYETTFIIVTHDPLIASRVDRVVAMRDGRASTEIRRHGGSAQEWVILDRLGRLQLPRAYVNRLEMQARVRVHLEPDHVSVWPHQTEEPCPSPPLKIDEPVTPMEQKSAPAGVSVTLDQVSRTFELAGDQVRALRDVSLAISAGSLSAVKGPSGSGKTTLLNLLAGLDDPTAGDVRVGGQLLTGMSPQARIDFRRRQIGYVFQTFGLLPFLTVEENVQVPLRLLATSPRDRAKLVKKALDQVGLADRAGHRTYELSGGEQQRVAIARALVKGPALLLADEPTGQLDSLTGASIIALLKEIAAQLGVTVVVASHDPRVHEAADWVFELEDGRLVGSVE